MPLSIDNVIQSKTGSFDGSSSSATLDVGTTAGSAVVIFAAYGANGTSTYDLLTPSGFTLAGGINGTTSTNKAVPKVFVKTNVGAGETSWTLTMSPTAGQVTWVAVELTGVGLDPLTAFFTNVPSAVTPYDGASPSTQTSGTTPTSTCFDVLAFAVHAARADSTTPPAWSGQTNGFTELAEVSQVNATNAVSMAVSYKPSLAIGTFESTGSLSPSSPATGTMVVLYADGAKHAPNFDAIFGAECGTGTNLNVGSTGYSWLAPWDDLSGTPAVVTSTPKSGVYCLELSSVALAEYVAWTSTGILGHFPPTTGYPVVTRFAVRFPTSLPAAGTTLFEVDAGSTGTLALRFDAVTAKLGVKVGSGTEVLSDAVPAADKWIGIDVRYDSRVANHLCDWQVDYDTTDATGPVAQTQAVGAGTAVNDVTAVRFGWRVAVTATVRYDDIAIGKNWGMFPIGDIEILMLGPDPAGTPAIVGNAANWKTFVNNGTKTAWNGTDARNRLDEIPPVVGASADGICQVTAQIGDYAEIPMATYTAAPNYCLRALRWYVAAWAASTQPAEIEVRAYDGVAELVIAPAGDHGQDNSSLRWLCVMHRDTSVPGFYQLTQAKLDALTMRQRGTADVTPDAGILNAHAELAVQKAVVYGSSNVEGGAFQIYVRQDPVTAAMASILVTTPPGSRGATAYWTINGTDGSQYVTANTTWEKLISASSVEEVTVLGLTPDPT